MKKLEEILSQKTTWAGLALIATVALPQFGVPENVVKGIQSVLVGLTAIFLRQGVAKANKK